MAKLYPVSPPSLFPPLITPPQIQPPVIRPPKLTGSNYTYSSPNSNYYNWYTSKLNQEVDKARIKDIGDIIFGHPLNGTRQLQETLEKNNLKQLIGSPILSRLAGLGIYVRDDMLKPYGDAFSKNFKDGYQLGDIVKSLGTGTLKTGVNLLEATANSIDTVTFANPIKAYLGAGGNGPFDSAAFLRSMGWLDGEYREIYNWDVDIDNPFAKVVTDILLEVASDPTSWVSFGVGGAVKQAGKQSINVAKEALTGPWEDILKQGRHLQDESIIRDITELGFKDYDDFVNYAFKRIEENPEIIADEINRRLDKTVHDLDKRLTKAKQYGNEEEIIQLTRLIATTQQYPIMTSRQIDAFKRALQSITQSTEYTKYKGAVAFQNRYKEFESKLNNVALGFGAPGVLAFKNGMPIVKDRIERKLTEGYFNLDNYSMHKLRKQLKITPVTRIEETINDYLERFNELLKARNKEYSQLSKDINTSALMQRVYNLILYAPAEQKADLNKLRSYARRKVYELLTKESEYYKNLSLINEKYKEQLIKYYKDTEFREYINAHPKIKKKYDNIFEMNKAMTNLNDVIDEAVSKAFSVASEVEDIKFKELQKVYEDYAKATPDAIYRDVKESISLITQSIDEDKDIDWFVNYLKNSDILDIFDINLIGNLRLRGLSEHDLKQIYIRIKKIEQAQNYISQFKDPVYNMSMKELRAYIASRGYTAEYLKGKVFTKVRAKIDLNKKNISIWKQQIKDLVMAELSRYMSTNYGWYPKPMGKVAQQGYEKGLKNLNKISNALKENKVTKAFETKEIVKQTKGKEYLERVEKGNNSIKKLAKQQEDTIKSKLYNLLDKLNVDGSDIYYYLDAYLDLEDSMPDYINEIFKMNAMKSKKPFISDDLIKELIGDFDNFKRFMYFFKERLDKINVDKIITKLSGEYEATEKSIRSAKEILEIAYTQLNETTSSKERSKLLKEIGQIQDGIKKSEAKLLSIREEVARPDTLREVYNTFDEIQSVMEEQGVLVKNLSDDIEELLANKLDEEIDLFSKALGSVNIQVPQLNMFTKLVRISTDFCTKVDELFPDFGVANSGTRKSIRQATNSIKQYNEELGEAFEQAITSLERQYDQAHSLIRNVGEIDFHTLELNEEEKQNIYIQILDTLQSLSRQPDRIVMDADSLTNAIINDLKLNVLRIAEQEAELGPHFTPEQYEFFRIRKRINSLMDAEGYKWDKLKEEYARTDNPTLKELIDLEDWDATINLYGATAEDIEDFKKYRELFNNNIWDDIHVTFDKADERQEFNDLLKKVKDPFKNLNDEELERFEYLVGEGYLPDLFTQRQAMVESIKNELYDIIYPHMRNYMEELKNMYRLYGNAVKLYDIPNSDTLSLLTKFSSVLTNIVNDIADTGNTYGTDLVSLLRDIANLSKISPVYINKTELRKRLNLYDVKATDGIVRKSQLEDAQRAISILNTHDTGTVSGELKRAYKDFAIEASQYRNFTTAGAPEEIQKKIIRHRELELKRLEGLLTNEEMHEYYALEKEIKPWFLPTILYTSEDIKKLSGMNAYELARNTGIAVSNFVDAKLAKELGLTLLNSDALSDYQRLITFNRVQSYLKRIRALDMQNVVKRNVDEWSKDLFDYYIKNINEVGGLLLGMEIPDEDVKSFLLYSLDNQMKRAYIWAIKEIEPDNYQKIVNSTRAHHNALKKDKYKNRPDFFLTLDDDIEKQSDYIRFLDAANKERAMGKVMDERVIDALLEAESSEEWSEALSVIGTGATGVNKTYVMKQKRMNDDLRRIIKRTSETLDDASKNATEIKIANELTTHMVDPINIKLAKLTREDPNNLITYIANTNYTHGFIVVDAQAFKEVSNTKLSKVGLVKKPFVGPDGRLKAYVIYSTKPLPAPNPKAFKTFVESKLGTVQKIDLKYLSDPINKIHRMQDEFADFLSLTSYKINRKKHTKDVITDLTPLKYYNRGHKLNYRVLDAITQTKLFDMKGYYADKIRNATESEYLNLADFVFLTDSYTYNDILAGLLDVGIDYSELEGMYRAQSLLHSLNKGISNGINDISNNYKGVRLFFDKDTILSNRTKKFMKYINDNKTAFFKDNSKCLENMPQYGQRGLVPIILKQDKNGNPVIHRVRISDEDTLNQFIKTKHLIVDYETYSFLINNINIVGATSVRKILYNVLKPFYAMAYLTSTGFLVRNALDTLFIKNMETADGVNGLPKLMEKEYTAFKEINTYKRCMKELNAYALEHGLKHGPNKYTYAAVSKHWDKETLDTFKLVTIWSQTTAAGSLASDVRSAFKTKDFDTLFEECLSMALDNPISHFIMSTNEMIEQVGRLGLMHYLVDEKNLKLPEAVKEVVKTHFNYQIKDMGMEYLRDFFMFETFPINNTLYYLDIGLNRNPEMLKLLLDIEEESWGTGDITWDDVRNNSYLAQQVLMGNIRIGDYILKTGSSLMDFFNIVGAPLNAIIERSNPLIRAGINLDLRQADPFMAYPSRLKQIKKFVDTSGKEGSIVPSVYSKLTNGTKAYKRSQRRTYTRVPAKWTKYPKVRRPHKNYIKNYRFYTKPYYFKKPNTLAWATSKRDWNIRPTFKYPKGSYYRYMRRVNKVSNLNKFGPEVY